MKIKIVGKNIAKYSSCSDHRWTDTYFMLISSVCDFDSQSPDQKLNKQIWSANCFFLSHRALHPRFEFGTFFWIISKRQKDPIEINHAYCLFSTFRITSIKKAFKYRNIEIESIIQLNWFEYPLTLPYVIENSSVKNRLILVDMKFQEIFHLIEIDQENNGAKMGFQFGCCSAWIGQIIYSKYIKV